ncbi:MAG: AAA family ATPase [Deltaproteobacteria bacterium]|nr:AAA family ATPase [Deltaproteobacteria bacterium]
MNPSRFGLSRHPFDQRGGADGGPLSDVWAALVAELRAGLQAPQGITLLIGESGTGKSTLVRSLDEKFGDLARVVYVPGAGPGLRHLLGEALAGLGVALPGNSEADLVEALQQQAQSLADRQCATVIIIDDAQDLPAKTLERLSTLFGDDPADHTMLHVFLVGRPELLDRMNAASDRSVLKQLVQVCRMDPLDAEESVDYIRMRVEEVGGSVEGLFSAEVLSSIVDRAEGIPGRIDELCSRALEEIDGSEPAGMEQVQVSLEDNGGLELELEAEFIGEPAGGGRVVEPALPAAHVLGEDFGLESDTEKAQPLKASRRGASGVSESADGEVGVVANRRRLGLWAVGFFAVVAGLAAALTGKGPGADSIRMALAPGGRDDPAISADSSKVTAAGLQELSRVAVASLGKVDQSMVTAVPGLKVKRNRAAELNARQRQTFGKPVKPAASVTKASPRGSATDKAALAVASIAPVAASPAREPARVAPAVVAPAVVAPAVVAPAVAKPVAVKPPAPVAPLAVATSSLGRAKAEPRVVAIKSPPAALPLVPPPPAVVSRPVVKRYIAQQALQPVPASRAPAAAVPGPVAMIPASYYGLQLGAFSSAANAQALRGRASRVTGDVHLVEVTGDGRILYRVVAGRYQTAAAAGRAKTALAAAGLDSFVKRFGSSLN